MAFSESEISTIQYVAVACLYHEAHCCRVTKLKAVFIPFSSDESHLNNFWPELKVNHTQKQTKQLCITWSLPHKYVVQVEG